MGTEQEGEKADYSWTEVKKGVMLYPYLYFVYSLQCFRNKPDSCSCYRLIYDSISQPQLSNTHACSYQKLHIRQLFPTSTRLKFLVRASMSVGEVRLKYAKKMNVGVERKSS